MSNYFSIDTDPRATRRTANQATFAPHGVERRYDARMHIPLHVKVCGTSAANEAFEFEGVVDNISRGGLYVRINERLDVGAKLLIFVRPLGVEDETESTPFGIMRGVVKRVEPQPDGFSGLGIVVTHRRQQSPAF